MQKLRELLKKNKYIYNIAKEIYFIILKSRDLFERIIYLPMLTLRINPKKIVASSYFGNGFGDNPAAILDEMYNIYGDEYEYIWVLSKKNLSQKVPDYIKTVTLGSSKYYYHMSTAKYWIDNCRKNRYPFKRNTQIYLQTWHGGISFKKIEKDVEDKLPSYYVYNAIKDSQITDYMTSNSEFQTNMIKRAFWFDGEILTTGSPRLDKLFNDNYTHNIKNTLLNKYHLSQNKKIILYAPTFRNSGSLDPYLNNFSKLIDEIKLDAVILVKLHPNIVDNSVLIKYSEKVINVSDYPDIYDLMIISDIFITDYSSTMFEFSILKKPVFLFMQDYAEYNKERGSYFDIKELPFPISTNENELIHSINTFNQVKYLNDLELFMRGINLNETGKSAKEVVNYLVRNGKNDAY